MDGILKIRCKGKKGKTQTFKMDRDELIERFSFLLKGSFVMINIRSQNPGKDRKLKRSGRRNCLHR